MTANFYDFESDTVTFGETVIEIGHPAAGIRKLIRDVAHDAGTVREMYVSALREVARGATKEADDIETGHGKWGLNGGQFVKAAEYGERYAATCENLRKLISCLDD